MAVGGGGGQAKNKKYGRGVSEIFHSAPPRGLKSKSPKMGFTSALVSPHFSWNFNSVSFKRLTHYQPFECTVSGTQKVHHYMSISCHVIMRYMDNPV